MRCEVLHHHLHRDKKMFKWKVSGLGGKKEKSKTQQQQSRLNNEPAPSEVTESKNTKSKENNKKDK